MVHTCYGCKKFEKSGKCKIWVKIWIWILGIFYFFLFFYFLFVANFWKIHFILKWWFTEKKYVFCIFHVLHLPPPNQTAYIIYVVKVGNKLAKSWTISKCLQTKIPGKNRSRKIWEKSGYEIPNLWGPIWKVDNKIYYFMQNFQS